MNCTLVLLLTALAATAFADDWPTYRHDIARSSITSEKLATPLTESWVFRSRFAPAPAWEPARDVPTEGILELPRVRFDDAYHVVAADGALYFGSSADGKVTCLDAATGKVRWIFFTGGPVRLAPTVWQNRVYVGSDDGHVYCLDAANGSVVWQRRVGPSDLRLIGHGKMVSMWPVRTGVLIDNGVAYYGAGIFPGEGVYVEAVRATDGELVWRNDTGGEATDSRMSPQGYLLATSTNLFVPQGRASPTAFDRTTGKQIYEIFFGKNIGGTDALLSGTTLFTGTEEIIGYDGGTKVKVAWFDGRKVIITPDVAYMTSSNAMIALSRKEYPKVSLLRFNLRNQRFQLNGQSTLPRKEKKRLGEAIEISRDKIAGIARQLAALPAADPKRAKLETDKAELEATLKADEAKLVTTTQQLASVESQLQHMDKQLADANAEMKSSMLWQLPCECPDSLILAGDVLVAGGQDHVLAVNSTTGKKLWRAKVTGKARGLAVAGGRLFVSTDSGAIQCFAPAGAPSHGEVAEAANPSPYPKDQLTVAYEAAADNIARESGVKRGFCLVLGCETGRLALELAKRTELNIIGIEPDAQKVTVARKALDAAGFYGGRVTVDQGELDHLPYAPYFANLIVSDTALLGGLDKISAKEMWRVLKPIGGVAMIGQPAEAGSAALKKWFAGADAAAPQISESRGAWAKLVRGALPGAGQWTHAYANAANTTCGDDKIVKAPLGLLWFGDPGPLQMVSRHRRAAAPLSVNGVMFVQGEHAVNAYDAYNGLKLWDYKIPNVVRTGVSQESSNLAADGNSFFVANSNKCVRLDAATGALKTTFTVPDVGDKKRRTWGHVAIVDGTLLGTGTRVDLPLGKVSRTARGQTNYVSDIMFAYDTSSGQLRWMRTNDTVANTSISIGDGRIFFADNGVPQPKAPGKKREKLPSVDGKPKPSPIRNVMALDLTTGKPIWRKQLDLSGSVGGAYWGALGSMYKEGVLVIFGVYTDGHFWKEFFAGQFEKRRIMALAGSDGQQVWARNIAYRVRPLIVGNTLHAEPWAFDLTTGEQQTRINPVTGHAEPWQFARPGHHCGTPAACENVMFFRSGYLGYYDLTGDYGTAHFGGQRTGCWINFIFANGLVLVPEASSGCMCPFPNQCTVVFAPREENRAWAKYSLAGDIKPVKHLALNLGGPGDRKDAAGTLWLAYPRPKGSLVLQFNLKTAMLPKGEYFAQSTDSVRVEGTPSPWLYTFGVRGLRHCEIPLLDPGDGTGSYTVRLGFAEMENMKPSERVFNVSLQGKPALKNFDVVKEAGGARKAIIKEFKGVNVEDALAIELTPMKGSTPILQTVEVIRDRMLGVGYTLPSFLLSDGAPEQTVEVRLGNQTDNDFTGTLRLIAPPGFSVTPAETPIDLGTSAKKQVALKAAVLKPAAPGKYPLRIQLVRRDGGIESERETMIDYLGHRSRVVVAACEDAYVNHALPNTSNGGTPTLLVDGGDRAMADNSHQIAYLKFRLNVPGKPLAAKLRLYDVQNPTTQGGRVCLVTEPWSEKTVIYNKRPKSGETLAEIGPVAEDAMVEVPLNISLAGRKELSLAIEPLNTDGVTYGSREGGKPAELVVEYEK